MVFVEYKISFIILVFVAAVLFFVQQQEQPENSVASVNLNTTEKQADATLLKPEKKMDTPTTNSKNISDNISSNNSTQTSCISREDLKNDSRQAIFNSWHDEHLIGGILLDAFDYYRHSTEKSLIEDAKSGDTKAMWTLAMNYKWHSQHNTFQDPFFYPPGYRPNVKVKSRPLNIEMLEGSRSLFRRAAVQGLIGGLTEMKGTYDIEAKFLEKNHPNEHEKIKTLKLTGLAYNELIYWVSPDLVKVFGSQVNHELKNQQAYMDILNQLKSDWKKQRKKEELDFNIPLNPPKEIFELREMSKNVCW